MAKKTKIRYVDVNVSKDSFVSKLTKTKKDHDFSDVKVFGLNNNAIAHLLASSDGGEERYFRVILNLSLFVDHDLVQGHSDGTIALKTQIHAAF